MPWTSLCPRRLLHNRDAAILPRCALCQLHTRAFVAWWLSQSTSPYHVLCAQTICNTHDHSPCSCLPYGRGGARWDLNSKLRRTSLRRRKKKKKRPKATKQEKGRKELTVEIVQSAQHRQGSNYPVKLPQVKNHDKV